MASILHDGPVEITLSWLFGIIGILANGYVLIVIKGQSRQFCTRLFTKSSSANNSSLVSKTSVTQNNPIGSPTFITLITNLAIADLLASVYLLILASADLHYRFIHVQVDNNTSNSINSSSIYFQWLNDPFCYIARILNILSTFESVFSVAMIAIDRFISVTFPFSSKLKLTYKRALRMCLLSWALASFLAVMFTVFALLTFTPLTTTAYQHHNLCSFGNLSAYYVRLALFIFCIIGITTYLVILLLYIGTYYNLRRTVMRIQSVRSTNYNPDRRILIITFSIIITNLLAWFPSFICAISVFANPSILTDQINFFNAAAKLILLFQVNSSINPAIYIFSTSEWLNRIRSKIMWCFQRVDNNLAD